MEILQSVKYSYKLGDLSLDLPKHVKELPQHKPLTPAPGIGHGCIPGHCPSAALGIGELRVQWEMLFRKI